MGAGLVKSGLSPAQRDYLISKKAFDENLQAMRKASGGTATESSVNRLIQMAPGASTPDLGYLLRQTKQVHDQANTISKSITGIRGGQNVHRQAGGGNSSASARMPPQNIVAGMKEGQYVQSPDGTKTWQKVNGQLKQTRATKCRHGRSQIALRHRLSLLIPAGR